MANISIVLASTSRYRRELLSRLQIPFETWSPEVDEDARAGERPVETARRLAVAKAQAAASRFPSALIIGSDQVAEVDREPINKPGTLEAAREQLARLSGRAVMFHTALCLLNAATGRQQVEVVSTDVAFRRLDFAEIERYLSKEPAFDCAGSAKSEGLGISLLARMGGADPTALVGLPLITLSQMLRNEGLPIP